MDIRDSDSIGNFVLYADRHFHGTASSSFSLLCHGPLNNFIYALAGFPWRLGHSRDKCRDVITVCKDCSRSGICYVGNLWVYRHISWIAGIDLVEFQGAERLG